MKTIKCIIVDDEAPARELIRAYLSQYNEIEIVAESENGFDALKKVQELKPDLMFLDIQMPKISGFELLEVMENPPVVIFSTAYDQYAINAFEQNALDYLLKPYALERFASAIDKARNAILKSDSLAPIEKLNEFRDTNEPLTHHVVVRQGSKIIVIPLNEIFYFEAQDDYVEIHSSKGNFLKEKTMKYFETQLPSTNFVRVHRSYIVQMSYVDKIELYEKETHLVVMKDGSKLRASREGYKKLRELFH